MQLENGHNKRTIAMIDGFIKPTDSPTVDFHQQPGEIVKDRSAWDLLSARLRAVSRSKAFQKLRSVRDDAQKMKLEFEEKIKHLNSKISDAGDNLDKLAMQEEIEKIQARIKTISDGLTNIDDRVTELTKKDTKSGK